MLKPAKQTDYQSFRTVATVAEVAQIWRIHRSTIMYHVIESTIAADKSAGTWLLYLPSVTRVFGYPPAPLPEEITETRFVSLDFIGPDGSG